MSAELLSRQGAPMSAVPPPPGVKQNFINPPQTAGEVYVLVAVGVAVSGSLLIMRLYTKGIILRKFGWEDFAILLAFIFSTACCVLILEARKYGGGKHIWDIPITTLIPNWGKIVTAAVVIYCPAIMFSKVAVLLCYLRISTKSRFRVAVYITMLVCFAYNIALMLSLIFACRPIAKSWDLTITSGTCINRPAVYLANGVLNVATDFVILLLPVPLIRGLQMPKRQKILLAAMFSVGSLTCIVSVIRLKTLIPTLHAIDQTWAIARPASWIVVEINLAVACGCLSVVRPFLRHHFPFLVGESRSSRTETYAKASRSDYFSRGRSDVRSGDGSESNTRLSNGPNAYGHKALPSWDAVGYSQEIKSNAQKENGQDSPSYMDDVELGDVKPKAQKSTSEAYRYQTRESGDRQVTKPKDAVLADQSMGILKTMEVNVRR